MNSLRPALSLCVLLSGCASTPTSTVETIDTSTSSTESVVSTTPIEITTTTLPSVETMPPGWFLAGRVDSPIEIFESPGAELPILTLSESTDLGSQRVVLLLEGPLYEQDGWVRVAVPMKPSGTEGWARSSDLSLFPVDRWIEVSLTDRVLRVHVDNTVAWESAVAIGRPSNPTPIGHFFITDSVIINDETGPWGPHAFGTSAFSETVTEMNGSDAVIGIHGTNRPESIGEAASLGCIRLPNDAVLELATLVSPGVPVVIHE